MDFLNLVKERYSMRSFDGKPIEDEKISLILEAGRVAPTAKNLQPQRIFVLKSDEAIEKLSKATASTFGTKTAFVICYDKEECWSRGYDKAKSGEVDCSIIATHMMLEATSLGVGSTFVMAFNPEVLIREFDIPENLVPVCILVMGYPSKDAAPSPRHEDRKALCETVKYL